MRRADRLFRITQELRSDRWLTARALADLLEVSERTIYRDIQDLVRLSIIVEAGDRSVEALYVERLVGPRVERKAGVPGHGCVWRFRSRLLQCEMQRQLLVTEKDVLEAGLKQNLAGSDGVPLFAPPPNGRLSPLAEDQRFSSPRRLSRDEFDFSTSSTSATSREWQHLCRRRRRASSDPPPPRRRCPQSVSVVARVEGLARRIPDRGAPNQQREPWARQWRHPERS